VDLNQTEICQINDAGEKSPALGSPRRSIAERLRRSSEVDCMETRFQVNTKHASAEKKGNIFSD
jgi:hypothetical protein